MRIISIPLLLPRRCCLADGAGTEMRPSRRRRGERATAGAGGLDSVETVANVGGVTLEHLHGRAAPVISEARVKVRDSAVLVEEYSEGLELVAYWPLRGERTLVLLANAAPGTACERNYRVLELGPDSGVHLTDEFGSWWEADSLWFDGSGALWMRFPPFDHDRQEIGPASCPARRSAGVTWRGPARTGLDAMMRIALIALLLLSTALLLACGQGGLRDAGERDRSPAARRRSRC